MTQPRILVTGASGKTGMAVVQALRRADWPVRALVHREDARSERLRSWGAEVVCADLFDADALSQALRDVQRAYYVPLFRPHAAHAALAFAVAASASRLEGIVQLSQWLSHRAHPAVLTRETWLIDHLFAMVPGAAHVVINPGMFADNFLRVIDFAALLSVYPVLTGDSRCAPVSNEDVGRVAAAVLMDLDRHHGQRLRPTGPELLSGADMARVLAGVVGHRVVPVHLPFRMFLKAARWSGADIHEVYNYREYLRDHQQGAFSLDGGVTDVVPRLTGSPAEGFETIARRYAGLPFARQTLANRAAALARFSVLPFLPGFDLAAYERQMRFPQAATPSLASDDPRWLAEHAGGTAASAPRPVAAAAPVPAHRTFRGGRLADVAD